jgi:hypothetical protein
MVEFVCSLLFFGAWHRLFVSPVPKATTFEYGILVSLGAVFITFGLYRHTPVLTSLGLYTLVLGLCFCVRLSLTLAVVLVSYFTYFYWSLS